MRRMHRVYVAGAISGPTILQGLHNIGRGIRRANMLLRAGFAPFCPHLDYHWAFEGDVSVEQMYASSLAWLESAEALFVIEEGAMDSRGVKAEIERAQDIGIPVFWKLEDLQAWAALHPVREVECASADDAAWDGEAQVIGAGVE